MATDITSGKTDKPAFAKRTIGLLGGSFNPAHIGHRYISEQALKLLPLDEVWWLVSPLNPFKKADDMLDYSLRIQLAEDISSSDTIKVCDIENKIGTFYTADTLAWLIKKYPEYHFIWLMGDDLLKDFPLWKDWQKIPSLTDIAVFPRTLSKTDAENLPASRFLQSIGKWNYMDIKPLKISATEIRNSK